LEYVINTTPGILFNRLSTASGLSEWFADDVKVHGNTFIFRWDVSEQKAQQSMRKENVDDLTGDVALVIIDHVDKD